MPPISDFFGDSEFRTAAANFWELLAFDEALSGCDPLQKLVIGCEIIAALDDVDLIAA